MGNPRVGLMKMQSTNKMGESTFRYLLIGLALVFTSAALYLFQVAVFRRPSETLFYMVQDIAFLPVQVLLVTIILNEFLKRREKQIMLGKLNMVIGAFFSETGTELLRILSAYDLNSGAFRLALEENKMFSDREFAKLNKYHEGHQYRIDSRPQDLGALRSFLVASRGSVMRLLENPNLLEHETFTDMLWAVSHVIEEFSYRQNMVALNKPDQRHLEGDIERAYRLLTTQWLAYVKHLRTNYPYIFSLVIRINPYDPKSSPEFKDEVRVEFPQEAVS